MMGCRVMFSKIISFVQNALLPINVKLALANAVANPVKAHVDGFGSFLFDRVIGDSRSGTVVSLQRGGRLGMTKFFKTYTNRASFFAVVEKGCKLCFGGTGNDFTEDLAKYIDGTIGRWWGVIRLWGLGRITRATAEVIVSGSA